MAGLSKSGNFSVDSGNFLGKTENNNTFRVNYAHVRGIILHFSRFSSVTLHSYGIAYGNFPYAIP